MSETKYVVKFTTQFKKDFKLAMKRGFKMDLLEDVITLLAMGEVLPDKNKDHALTGNWVGHRECHILPDWLLVYRLEDDILVLTLTRTGTHSDLFGKQCPILTATRYSIIITS
jgi:mRNA interferase YafQ